MITQDRIANRLNELINQGIAVSQMRKKNGSLIIVDQQLFRRWQAGSLSALRQIFGECHPHYAIVRAEVTTARGHDVDCGLGLLHAAKDDVDGGWLTEVSTIVAA